MPEEHIYDNDEFTNDGMDLSDEEHVYNDDQLALLSVILSDEKHIFNNYEFMTDIILSDDEDEFTTDITNSLDKEDIFYYNDKFATHRMSLSDWEQKLSEGWDRVGFSFYRTRFEYLQNFSAGYLPLWRKCELMPLRFRLDDTFSFSKSQQNNQKRNKDLRRVYGTATITDEKVALFNAWYTARFGLENVIQQWVSGVNKPFPSKECCVYDKDKLIACSYFDATRNASYSTLAFYDPNEMKRSLGTYTMISEIEFDLKNKKKFHYPGHAHRENTLYDYKKKFANAERFDWDQLDWVAL
jgi:leucyl-tRNA---protein transferase